MFSGCVRDSYPDRRSPSSFAATCPGARRSLLDMVGTRGLAPSITTSARSSAFDWHRYMPCGGEGRPSRAAQSRGSATNEISVPHLARSRNWPTSRCSSATVAIRLSSGSRRSTRRRPDCTAAARRERSRPGDGSRESSDQVPHESATAVPTLVRTRPLTTSRSSPFLAGVPLAGRPQDARRITPRSDSRPVQAGPRSGTSAARLPGRAAAEFLRSSTARAYGVHL